MEAASLPLPANSNVRDRTPDDVQDEPIAHRFAQSQPWAYAASIATTILLLIPDAVLPRGATAAIGYCIVPVLAVGSRNRNFILGITILCTGLTWLAFFVEPPGAPWQISVFERSMVTLILWLTLLLVWRRSVAVTALAQQTQALEDAKHELERSNTELGSFASIIAHDIRSPLNSIGLMAQLIQTTPAVRCDPDSTASLESIRRELDHVNNLIQSLLVYGRVGAGELNATDCDCDAVLAAVRQSLRAELESSGGLVTNDPLPVIRADPTLISNLFQNLIQNSIKYRGEAPPRIHVSATNAAASWQFSVRDNGIGIDPEDLPRLFQPFRQSRSGQRRRGGVGLGLATCKRIVERHAGRIDLRSTPGDGTTFLFTIPT